LHRQHHRRRGGADPQGAHGESLQAGGHARGARKAPKNQAHHKTHPPPARYRPSADAHLH